MSMRSQEADAGEPMMSVPVLGMLATPRSKGDLLDLYSPRSGQPLYTPRTHAEQLQLTGSKLSDAQEKVNDIADAVAQLSARAAKARAAFAARDGNDHSEHGACPICLESLSGDIISCRNRHLFCGDCLRNYRRFSPRSPRPLQCPLCRVAMPEVLAVRQMRF